MLWAPVIVNPARSDCWSTKDPSAWRLPADSVRAGRHTADADRELLGAVRIGQCGGDGQCEGGVGHELVAAHDIVSERVAESDATRPTAIAASFAVKPGASPSQRPPTLTVCTTLAPKGSVTRTEKLSAPLLFWPGE